MTHASTALRTAALGAALLAAAPAAHARTDVPLIPREVLFGNPDRSGVQISPDGSMLSYLAPVDGVLNVWVAPVDEPRRGRPVTSDEDRGVRIYFWSYSNDEIIYLQDTGGDENWQLHVTDVRTGETRNLTPFEEIINPATGEPMIDPATGKKLKPTVQIQEVSHRFPDEILIGLNNRDPRFHDVHRIDLASGEMEMLQENNGFLGFVSDKNYDVRMALRPRRDGGMEMLTRGDGDAWLPFITVERADALTTQPLGFSKDGRTLFMLDSRDRDTAALAAVGMESAERRILASDPRADIDGAAIHPTERHVQAASSTYERKEWQVLDDDVRADFERLRTVADGDFAIGSRTLDDTKWIVSYVMDDGPVHYYLYHRPERRAEFLYVNREDLTDLPLAEMHPITIESRDGLPLVCYYTLPVWSDTDGDAVPESPLPTVLLVHGGPWARDVWGFDAIHQWLANRGYAVLSVNFRGSTGFGKSFLNAANLEWAGAMHDDLLDAVSWAVEEGVADEDRVAIMGGSYGGYATLVGLTFTPERFAAGVDIVGPSNLVTLLESIPPYWESFRDQFRARVGDIDTVEGRIFLRSRSPLTHVDEIVRPLLIGQGANDPRVKEAESVQIVEAMEARDIPVTYVRFPDEGHGFARPENRLSFFAVTEIFLAQHLGGVYEEIGDDFENSSIEVPTGASDVPGVPAALKRTE